MMQADAKAQKGFSAPRDAARQRFAELGIRLDDLTIADLRELRKAISSEMKAAHLIRGYFKMNASIKIVNRPRRWAALTCRSYAFDKREAVTFNPDGFIGLAGWADDKNVAPILAGFLKWCDMIAKRQGMSAPSDNQIQSPAPQAARPDTQRMETYMDDSLIDILQHSLGLDRYGRGTSYRNHFVTGPGSTDYDACIELVGHGYMTRRPGSELSGGDDIFTVTDAGRAAASTLRAKPKLTPGKQRYQDYLEGDSDLPFGDWLKRRSRARAAELADLGGELG